MSIQILPPLNVRKYYYIDSNGNRKGPVEAYRLPTLGIGRNSYVWAKGMKDWDIVDNVPDLYHVYVNVRLELGNNCIRGIEIPPFYAFTRKDEFTKLPKASFNSRKYHFSSYYHRYRICMNYGEYVPDDNICPACGKKEMDIRIADKYSYSNLRKCDNCSYESYSFSKCPKCDGEMTLVHPYLIGDFTSLGEHSPSILDCSEDEEIIEISETYLRFNASSDITKKIDARCNYYDWYVEDCPKWIRVSKDWDDCRFFNLTISSNLDKQDRSAAIEPTRGKKET
ncbi:MAG: DUF4339 domain-containing protein [Bacteroidaceae bacterium]|nr:DUF4339 domain-containing protein [Bacteroidaceae bacterium]